MNRGHIFILIAFASTITGCAHHMEAAATPPPAAILTAENRAKASAVGRTLAEQDRIAEEQHLAEMNRVIDVSVLRIRDTDRETSLMLRIRNKSAKPIRALDAGLKVYLLSNGRRVGLAELHLTRDIAAHKIAEFSVPLRYVRFGEDTGSMRLAQGKPKRAEIEVTEIRYADGSDTGYDD